MRSTLLIGQTGKGPLNTPIRIDNIKDLHLNFGKNTDLIATAEQILYNNNSTFIIRVGDNLKTATNYLCDENDTICMLLRADSGGETGALTTVKITNNGQSFSIEVYNSGKKVEFWSNLKISNIEDTINPFSNWIQVELLKPKTPASATIDLFLEESSSTTSETHYLQAMKLASSLDAEFILTDCSDVKTINTLLEHIEDNGQDSILLIHPPKDYDLFDTYDWHKAINPSEYGAIFWPWLSYGKKFIPPTGPILSSFLNSPIKWKIINENLSGVDDVQFHIHKSEIGYLSSRKNPINLVSKNKDGLFVGKPKTLAGLSISDRRMLSYIKSEVSKIGKNLLRCNDPYNTDFKNEFIKSCEYILEQIREGHGINNYGTQICEMNKLKGFLAVVSLNNYRDFFNIEFKFVG